MNKVFSTVRWSICAVLLSACLATVCAAAPVRDAARPKSGSTARSVPSKDWHILNDPVYDYANLKMARMLGYSDRQRASIVKIARLTGLPFQFILSRVHQGQTFSSLASDYGLRLGDVLAASNEQARIAKYLRLHRMMLAYGSRSGGAFTPHTTKVSAAHAEMKRRFGKPRRAFPVPSPAHIQTLPIATPEEAFTMILPPRPIAAAPVPSTLPPASFRPAVVTRRGTIHSASPHHRVSRQRAPRHHRSHKPRLNDA